MTRRLLFALFILTLLLTACAPTPAAVSFPTFILVTQNPDPSATPTPFQPSFENDTPLPTFTPAPEITDTSEPTLTFTPAPIPVGVTAPPIESTSTRTNYILYTTLDFDARSVTVDETIRYYNSTGTTLSDIVLSVQPNRYSNCFTLHSLAQDNVVLTSYILDDQRLTITLPQPLQSGTATTFTLNFDLFLPVKRSEGLFGYDFNQINLVDWYPFIVPYSGGWVLHDPWPFGEYLVYDASDIEVNIKAAPEIIIAASAPAEANGEWTRYRIYAARTFALSASDEFLMSETAVGTTVIRSYYFSGYEGAGEGMLHAASQAIALFDVKFAPYPYQSISVVQTDIHDGQEYDGLVFLSTDFYAQYGGAAKSNLVTIGVHEIAHQWWFGLVGNDQALEPWLDEAMALYSERLFYEWNYPRYGDWWWDFRVNYFEPSGWVDTTIYNGGTFRTYTNAVYLDGAYFIEALRVRMGDDNFYRFLKDYASRYSRGRATSYDFFAVARQNTDEDISDLMNTYFQNDY